MERVKLLKVGRGEEAKLSAKMAEFFNRQGKIGNHVGCAKILVYADGSIGASIPYYGDKDDDGRQIEGIEERKSFLICLVTDCDTALVDKFYVDHADGYDISKPFIQAVGNETLYFIAATKRPSDEDNLDEDEIDTDEESDFSNAESVSEAATDSRETVEETAEDTQSDDDDSPFVNV